MPRRTRPDFLTDPRYECLVQLFPNVELPQLCETLQLGQLADKAVELSLAKENRIVRVGSFRSWDTTIARINHLISLPDYVEDGTEDGAEDGDVCAQGAGGESEQLGKEKKEEEEPSEEDIAMAQMKEILSQLLDGEELDADVKDVDMEAFIRKLEDHVDALEHHVQDTLLEIQGDKMKKVSDIVDALLEMGFADADKRRALLELAPGAAASSAKPLIDEYCIMYSEHLDDTVSTARSRLMAAYTKAVVVEEQARLTENILSARYRKEGTYLPVELSLLIHCLTVCCAYDISLNRRSCAWSACIFVLLGGS